MRARAVGRRLGVVALVLVTGVIGACGGGDDDDEGAAAEPPPTTSTVPPPVTPQQVPPARCQQAGEDDLNDIALSMTIFETHLEQAVTATVGPYRYVAGNLVDGDGAVVPGPSVWAFDGEVLYAVSDVAATYSSFFPNRDPLVDADDAAVAALVRCVTPP